MANGRPRGIQSLIEISSRFPSNQSSVRKFRHFIKLQLINEIFQVPIIPVVIPRYKNLNNVTRHLTASKIPIHVLEPIRTEGKTMEDVMKETQHIMQQTIDKVS